MDAETTTRRIVDYGGHVCGLIAHGDHTRAEMEDVLSSRLCEERPLGGRIERGFFRWVPNQWAEPRDADVLLYSSEEGIPGSFFATYLDLRKSRQSTKPTA